jgi:high-affinity iron transporter
VKDPSSASLENPHPAKTGLLVLRIVLGLAAFLVLGVLAWQGLASGGNPNPTDPNLSPMAAGLNIAVLVFREGLECVLVLTAITASMVGSNQPYRQPIAAGAGIGFLATIITWFVVVGIVSDLGESLPALDVQAATGLVAVVVLLIVMNWFFHKVYWGGWISMHNRKKKDLLGSKDAPETSAARMWWGLGVLGFFSMYREGFEVVLFLQSYYLKMGGKLVLYGALTGLFLTGIVAVLNFIAHRKLPYRKMLIVTGIMLGAVLLIMVGEQAQEMQLARWIPTTNIGWLENKIPDWAGVWFSIFPTRETLLAQLIAFALVAGSYLIVRLQNRHPSSSDGPSGLV